MGRWERFQERVREMANRSWAEWEQARLERRDVDWETARVVHVERPVENPHFAVMAEQSPEGFLWDQPEVLETYCPAKLEEVAPRVFAMEVRGFLLN